jgi:[ribosomal protein S18]-alanine N-acetyltransferase
VPFVIRDFQLKDFETLWLLDQDCFSPGIAYSRQELKTYVRHAGAITLVAEKLVAEKETVPGRVAQKEERRLVLGFLVAHPGTTGHIITIDVERTARRSGVGSLLLRGAEERLRAARSRSVGLETAVDNLSALSFYKRHGYSVIKTWPRYYSNGVDALVLKKVLG